MSIVPASSTCAFSSASRHPTSVGRVGRWLTRYITIPFGAALVILEGVDLIRREVWCRLLGTVYQPLFGPIFRTVRPALSRAARDDDRGLAGTGEPGGANRRRSGGGPGGVANAAVVQQPLAVGMIQSDAYRLELPPDPGASARAGAPMVPFLAPVFWVLLGLLILGLIYFVARVSGVSRCRSVALGSPAALCGGLAVAHPAVADAMRHFVKSWGFQFVARVVFKPLVFALLAWWAWPKVFDSWWPRLFVFLGVLVVLNSRPGRGLEDAGSRGILRSLNWLHAGLVEGFVHLIVQVFKAIIDGLEYILYTVDEWLRFRGGEGRVSMIIRAAAALVWFPVSYIIRI